MSEFTGDVASAAIRSALERCGAGAAFGLPGGPNHALFQALRTSTTRLVVPTHELAAAFMAGTYGRVSGRPGILLTIPGPGFAYALPGIAEAWQDSAALVHIVSASPDGPHQRHRHQALDQAAMARPIVKAIFAVSDITRLGETISAAYEAARGGEPGPVLVQLGGGPDWTSGATCKVDQESAAGAIWARIHRARKPVLLLGQGCVHSAALIRGYAERSGTPVFTTPSGRGVVPESSPWCLGFDGLRNSTDHLNAFLSESDLVIAVGTRLAFNGTAGFTLALPAERLVHVDASQANLNAVYRASAAVAMTAEAFFRLPESTHGPRTAWGTEALEAWRLRIRGVYSREPEPTIAGHTPEQFFARLRARLPDDALVVTDSGLHQVLARRYFEVRETFGLLLPTDLQAMGFGLPSAIAARLAAPSRAVVALVGDGGTLMSGLELATAVREKIALTAVVFNDGYLNQIRLQQLRESGRGSGVALPAMDFRALAETVGANYVCGDAASADLIGRAAQGSGVTLIEVPVTDSLSVLVEAARGRTKAAIRGALGTRLRGFLKRRLRR